MESLRKDSLPTNFSSVQNEKLSAYVNKKDLYVDKTRGIITKLASFIIVATLVFSVVRNFIYIDIPNKCFIGIEPGVIEFNNGSLVEGLGIIKKVSPEDYQKVCKNVNRISPNVGCGGVHGGCYYESQPKKIYVNNVSRIVLYASAIIVHEACHSAQFAEGRGGDESECYIADDQIIKKIVQY